jgi:squalene-hopene/tetraprenyl-beta-curcumene cyclase
MTGLREELPARVDSARRRLVEHLVGQVDTDGAVRGRCASRVLESALMLLLLRKENQHPDIQENLTHYLQHTPPSSVLDSAIIDAAAHGRSDRGRELVANYLDRFHHYTGTRKRMLLNTVMALLGLMPHDQNLDSRQILCDGFATWTNLTLCAIKILTEHAQGRPDSADHTHLLQQLSGGSVREVWEGNVLAHLIALHAGAEFRPRSSVVREHIRILIRVQNPDGGMPFIDSQDIYLTAIAGLALTQSGLACAHAARMGRYIAARQAADGGWGYADKVRQTDTDDTAWCLDFLRAIDPAAHRSTIEEAERYFTTIAGPDGGFPTYIRGHAPDPEMTAGAVIALAPVWTRHGELLRASAGFLLDSQYPDGTFRRDWTLSASSTIARAAQALDALPSTLAPELQPRIAHAITLSRNYLEATRNPDGGWGHGDGDDSDVLSTARALSFVARFCRSDITHDAVRYLLERQQDNGGFTSIPDQVGPRPFVFDFPVLTDIMTLHALNQWCKHTDDPRSR